MDIDSTTAAVDAAMRVLLSPKRADHSRRVAAAAEKLCVEFGVDPRRGRLAGLAHDMCKELAIESQWNLAKRLEAREGLDWLTESLYEDSSFADKIVHGPAAAERLLSDFCVDDPEMIEAVALHTLGDPAMKPLSAILFIADKTEPGRGRPAVAVYESAHMDETDEIGGEKSHSKQNLDELLAACVRSSISWLESRGDAVAGRSRLLYNALKAEVRQQ